MGRPFSPASHDIPSCHISQKLHIASINFEADCTALIVKRVLTLDSPNAFFVVSSCSTVKSLECPKCKCVFCPACGLEPHPKISCEEVRCYTPRIPCPMTFINAAGCLKGGDTGTGTHALNKHCQWPRKAWRHANGPVCTRTGLR